MKHYVNQCKGGGLCLKLEVCWPLFITEEFNTEISVNPKKSYIIRKGGEFLEDLVAIGTCSS